MGAYAGGSVCAGTIGITRLVAFAADLPEGDLRRIDLSFRARVEEILEACPGCPVSVEVLAESTEDMLAEATEYTAWSEQIVVKIPMSLEGLPVIHKLERERDVRVNVTCMMNFNQM